ncbi:MAG: response regulator [Deltaproteobacteria bacterium]|nr:response regulator [Deltaproteobacteria bacterium]
MWRACRPRWRRPWPCAEASGVQVAVRASYPGTATERSFERQLGRLYPAFVAHVAKPAEPSVDGHEVGARVARAITALTLPALVALACWVPFVGFRPREGVALVGILVMFTSGRLLVRLRHPNAAAWAGLLVASAIVVSLCIVDGGVYSPAAPTYLIVIAYAAVVRGPRGAIALTLIGAAAFAGLAVAGRLGLLPPPDPGAERAMTVSMLINTLLAGGLAAYGAKLTKAAFAASRHSAAEAETGRRRLELRAREHATLAELGRLALSNLELPELFTRVARDLTTTLDVAFVDVLGIDLARRQARMLASTSNTPTLAPEVHLELTPGSLATVVAEAAGVTVVPDLAERRDLEAPRLVAAGVRASLCVQLRDHDQVIGLVAAHSRTPRQFDADQIHFLQGVANIVSAALGRRRAEAELAASQEHLRQAAKMDAVGRLAGGIAHDFNNLMTGVLSFADLALADPLSEQQRSDIEGVRTAAQRAAALTRQLLAFSRRQVLRPQVVDPNASIRDLEKLLTRVIGEDIALVTELDAAADGVLVDPVQLEQVLLNLAVNARQAMPDGGTVELRTALVTVVDDDVLPAGAYAQISVKDSGHGIAPDVLPHVFEPFFTTKFDGTGLGLATVYGVVKQSGGDVRVESPPNCGATFRVLLPRVARVQANVATPVLAKPPGTGPRRILVVDDEPAIVSVAVRALKAAGHVVLGVTNPVDAERAFEREPFDLVLSDVVMPQTTGPELVKRLRAKCAAARFLLMSGYVGDALDRRHPADSNVELIAKPFSPATLREAVARAFRAAPAPGDAEVAA